MKKHCKLLSILVVVTLLFMPCFVDAEPEETPSESPTPTPTPSESPVPISISLNKNSVELIIEKSFNLTATTNQDDAVIEWSSDNEDIVTVDQNGKITAKNTTGTATITATIKGTNITATCKVKVRKLGTNSTLKSLKIKNAVFDKNFESNVHEYTITISSTTNTLDFTNLDDDLTDPNAGYHVNAPTKLENGSVVKIVVTSEDKSEQTVYELKIIKNTTSLSLKSLKINGYALNEIFKANTLKYTANIPNEIDTITVEAKPEDSNAKVSISNTSNLKVGQNTIIITVKDNDGNSRKYEIVVTRNEKTVVSENPTSIITSSDNSTTSTEVITDSNKNNGSSENNFIKYFVVSLACLILFAIGGIGIYFYIQTSPKKLKKELSKVKKKIVENPIIEVDSDANLLKTKEFKKEELLNEKKPENLDVDD